MTVTNQDPEDWIRDRQRDKFEQFRREEVVGDHCEKCQFSPDPVIKEGTLNARAMLVGEHPTAFDDHTGPFSESHRELLGDMVKAIDLDPEDDCYITNTVLCGGVDESIRQVSVEACSVNVRRQLELVDPDVVLAMGKLAYRSLYRQFSDEEVSGVLGHQGGVPDFPWVEAVVSLSPIHVLRAESGSPRERKLKKLIWTHLRQMKQLLSNNVDQGGDDE